jgi:hypothetical protein
MKRYLLWAMLALGALAVVLLPGPAAAQHSNGARDQGNWTARSVSELIAAIDAANLAGGSHTINLAPGKTFTLTGVNNITDGPTGLPVIAANNNLTIRGNGATIARSTAPGTPAFRLFDVAPGAALTLDNLTLANGQVIGDAGTDACGGAILNAAGASLNVKNTAFVRNQVVGGDGAGGLGGFGYGGAIWNDGAANLDYVVFRGNLALGGATANSPDLSGWGGVAFGGAISSQSLGTLTIRNCWFTGNRAIGGHRHDPSALFDGIAASGAIDNWGTASISGSTFTDNQAIGGAADDGVDGGYGAGGAVSNGSPLASNPVCTIQNCRFSHNQAIAAGAGPENFGGTGVGGALSSGYSQNAARITVTGCSFTANQAIGGHGGFGGWGVCGAFNLESPSTASIAHCTFANNRAVGREAGGMGFGGAIGNTDYDFDDGSGASLMISDCTFTGNEALAAPGGNGDYWTAPGLAFSGAVDTSGSTTILNSTFMNNRAVAGALSPGAAPGFYTASSGGGLSSWGGALYIRDSSFVGNQVIGGDGSLGGPASIAMGGGITVFNGLPATIINCSLFHNSAVGGAGGAGAPGGAGVGGGLNVGIFPEYGSASGPSSTVTVTGTTISYNQAIGGAGGGEGKGGGYAVGTGVLFGIQDTSSVTLNGGSRIEQNKPDDAFHF